MFKKLVLNVYFEKKRIMVLFLLVCSFLIFYTTVQTAFMSNSSYGIESTPDFVFTGTIYNSEDGTYPFIFYNDIEGMLEATNEIVGDKANCYGLVCRSLYNYYDDLTSVGFSGYVYGMPNELLQNNIKKHIKKGNLPNDGKKEAVIGYYFAKRFNIDIGDKIPQAVTLNKEWTDSDIDNYTVVGILEENVSTYFNGSVLISRETFNELYGDNEDNMIMGYFNTNKDYCETFIEINNISSNYKSPEGTLNYKQKELSSLKLKINIGVILLMSVTLIFSVVSYLMKGITPKIGLLKATGMSTSYIIKTFISGTFVIIVLSTVIGIILSNIVLYLMNMYVSNFYGFTVHLYSFNYLSYILVCSELLFIIAFIFIVLIIKCKAISPKIAMMKTI